MRDWWYGDKRDIVKWGAVVALARKRSIPAVLQVALYRPDLLNYHLILDGTSESLPVEVVRHFRDIENIRPLEPKVNLQIDVYKEHFQWHAGFRTRDDFRKAYFNGVCGKVQQYDTPVMVFLDPDTGIAPKSYGYEHVTHHEIRVVLQAMKDGDILLFYQQARLGDGDWRNSTMKEFREAVGLETPVGTITCDEIANDVVFYAVDRSDWVYSVKDRIFDGR